MGESSFVKSLLDAQHTVLKDDSVKMFRVRRQADSEWVTDKNSELAFRDWVADHTYSPF